MLYFRFMSISVQVHAAAVPNLLEYMTFTFNKIMMLIAGIVSKQKFHRELLNMISPYI